MPSLSSTSIHAQQVSGSSNYQLDSTSPTTLLRHPQRLADCHGYLWNWTHPQNRNSSINQDLLLCGSGRQSLDLSLCYFWLFCGCGTDHGILHVISKHRGRRNTVCEEKRFWMDQFGHFVDPPDLDASTSHKLLHHQSKLIFDSEILNPNSLVEFHCLLGRCLC